MKKALFLDRDGVVNMEKNYVYRIEDFEFVDGIFSLIQAAQKMGYLPIIITNQAGIGRGYYSEDDFSVLSKWMVNEFANQGVHIAGVFHCPYHESAGIGEYRRVSFDRKPNPGMLFRARDELQIDLGCSILIGDKWSDIEAGRKAGVKTLVLYSRCSVESIDMPGLQGALKCTSLYDIKTLLFS